VVVARGAAPSLKRSGWQKSQKPSLTKSGRASLMDWIGWGIAEDVSRIHRGGLRALSDIQTALGKKGVGRGGACNLPEWQVATYFFWVCVLRTQVSCILCKLSEYIKRGYARAAGPCASHIFFGSQYILLLCFLCPARSTYKKSPVFYQYLITNV